VLTSKLTSLLSVQNVLNKHPKLTPQYYLVLFPLYMNVTDWNYPWQLQSCANDNLVATIETHCQ